MRGKISLIIGFIVFSSSVQVYAQNSFENFVTPEFLNRSQDRQFNLNFRRAGAEVLGMGGAGLTTVSTPVAVLWNPGALTRMSRLAVSVNGSFNLDSKEITAQRFAGFKIESEVDPQLYPTFAGVAYPFKLGQRQVTAGFAYDRLNPMTAGLTNKYFIYPAGLIDFKENVSGGVYAIVPSLAIELTQHISAGFSYHSLGGSSDYSYKIQSPFADETQFFAFQDEESYSGSYLLAGVLLKPLSWLSLGATITPGWQFTIEEKKETSFVVQNALTGEGATDETPQDSLDEFKFDIPLFYSFGVSLEPGAGFTLAFDFEARPWSKAELITNGNSASANLENAHSLHFGLQYLASSSVADFPIRFGYYTNPSPYRDQFFQGRYLGGQIKGGVFTVGMGISTSSWDFNLAYESGTKETEWWFDAGDFYNDRISKTEEHFNEIILSTSYRL